MSLDPDTSTDTPIPTQPLPLCPHCGERDRVRMIEAYPARVKVTLADTHRVRVKRSPQAWCERCCGWVAALSLRPGRYVPDF